MLVPRYVDLATGNTWTGRGPKPTWLFEALSAGTLAEHLLVS
ncbi:MAG: H-NS histone family protein [Pseudomonas sp.]|nr:MAG: H-NS histone family protein [Pseudomonas sp.]